MWLDMYYMSVQLQQLQFKTEVFSQSCLFTNKMLLVTVTVVAWHKGSAHMVNIVGNNNTRWDL